MYRKIILHRLYRLWKPFIFLCLAMLVCSFCYLHDATAIYTDLKNTVLSFNPFYYFSSYSFIIIFFIMCLNVFYVYRTSHDYRQGKIRWKLMPYPQKMNILADFIILIAFTIILHFISYIFLSTQFHQHIEILSQNHVTIPKIYQDWQSLVCMNPISSILFPSSISAFLILLSFYSFLVIGSISFIYMLVNNDSPPLSDAILYVSGVLLVYLSFQYWKSDILQILLLLTYSILFLYLLKKNGRLRVC